LIASEVKRKHVYIYIYATAGLSSKLCEKVRGSREIISAKTTTEG
jgi:hypothetical protein